MESKFIKYQNINVHYRSIGKGVCVILLHGFGEDSNIWNTIINALKTDFNLLIPDIPGSGKSEMLTGENILIDDYAVVIKTILDKENITMCSMIGHSMGGYIALSFAEKYSESLIALGLFHSSAFADDKEKKQARLKGIDFINKNGAHAFLKTTIPNLFSENFKLKYSKEIDRLIENGKSFLPQALIQYYNAMINRTDTTDLLKTFDKPVLFIIGEMDKAVPMQTILQQCHLPSVSHIYVMDTGHMGMLEDTEKSKEILWEFLHNI